MIPYHGIGQFAQKQFFFLKTVLFLNYSEIKIVGDTT